MRPLTPKQDRFVDEYLIDLNATAAADRAGYSDPNYGRQLITKPNVAAAVRERMEARARRTNITADRVLAELARIGFADIRDLFTWDEQRTAYVPSEDLTEDQAAVVSAVKSKTTHHDREDGGRETRIELELKTYDKLGALAKLGQHLGLFTERAVNIDPANLSDEELRRIAAGEDPIRVLADARGGDA